MTTKQGLVNKARSTLLCHFCLALPIKLIKRAQIKTSLSLAWPPIYSFDLNKSMLFYSYLKRLQMFVVVIKQRTMYMQVFKIHQQLNFANCFFATLSLLSQSFTQELGNQKQIIKFDSNIRILFDLHYHVIKQMKNIPGHLNQ